MVVTQQLWQQDSRVLGQETVLQPVYRTEEKILAVLGKQGVGLGGHAVCRDMSLKCLRLLNQTPWLSKECSQGPMINTLNVQFHKAICLTATMFYEPGGSAWERKLWSC